MASVHVASDLAHELTIDELDALTYWYDYYRNTIEVVNPGPWVSFRLWMQEQVRLYDLKGDWDNRLVQQEKR